MKLVVLSSQQLQGQMEGWLCLQILSHDVPVKHPSQRHKREIQTRLPAKDPLPNQTIPGNKVLILYKRKKPPRQPAVPVFLPQSHIHLPGWILLLPDFHYIHFSKHGRNFAKPPSGRSLTTSFFVCVDHKSLSAGEQKICQQTKVKGLFIHVDFKLIHKYLRPMYTYIPTADNRSALW